MPYLALEDTPCEMKLLKLKVLIFATVLSNNKGSFPWKNAPETFWVNLLHHIPLV